MGWIKNILFGGTSNKNSDTEKWYAGADTPPPWEEREAEENTPKIEKEYRISKVTPVYIPAAMAEIDDDEDGAIITFTNTENPFDYFTKHIPEHGYTEDEFPIGRIIKIKK